MTRGRRTGGRPTTSADRALAHIEHLMSQCPGLSSSHVMRLAGLGDSTIVSIRASNRLAIETEEAILAVQPRHVALRPPPHVPALPAVQHIRRLIEEADSTMDGVARATGIKKQTIRLLLQDRWSILNYPMYATIMALTVDDLRSVTRWTDRQPSITRARALQANGHSLATLSEQYGIKLSALVNTDPSERISVCLAEKVLAMYLDIGDRPGPSKRARSTAAAHGYFTPIHYDEDMNLIEVEREPSEALRARQTLCILGLTLEGRSVAEIMSALGLTIERPIAAARREYGLTMIPTYGRQYVAGEAVPGAIPAIREAIKGVHYRTDLDVLDDPGTDYAALLRGIREAIDPEATDRAA